MALAKWELERDLERADTTEPTTHGLKVMKPPYSSATESVMAQK